MAVIASFRCAGVTHNAGLQGGTNGIRDIGASFKPTTFPHPDGVGSGMNVRFGAPAYPGSGIASNARPYIFTSGFLNARGSTTIILGPNKFDLGASENPLYSTYSCSILFKLDGTTTGADTILPILTFLDKSGARVWAVAVQGYTLFTENEYQGNKVRLINATGGNINSGANTLAQNTWHRLEIQAQESGTKLTCRIYRFASATNTWTLVATRSGSPSHSIAAAAVKVGLTTAPQLGSIWDWNWGDFIAFDTFNADGNFPGWDPPPPAIEFKRWDGSSELSTASVSVWSGSAETPISTQGRQYPFGRLSRNEIAPPARDYGSLTQYASHDANCEYRVIRPVGTPPPGGWPAILWFKTNYFVTGSANDILADHSDFIDHALLHGWAVVGAGVTLAVSMLNPTAPTAPEAARKFPRQILDAKLALRHLQTNAAAHGLNPNKIVLAGQSSGGYIALAAALSTQGDNIGGKDLTLAGNGYTGSDPEAVGCLVFQAPVWLSKMWDLDPGHPYHDGGTGSQGAGSVRAALNLMHGYVANYGTNPATLLGTDLQGWIADNTANIPPIRYHYSSTDGIVPVYNHEALATAAVAAGINYSEEHDGKLNHENTAKRFRVSWKDWLDTL